MIYSLNENKNQTVLKTLLEFSDFFEEKLGHSDYITHKIDTGNDSPIRQYPRRLSYRYQVESQSPVKELLEQSFFQPCSVLGHPPINMYNCPK